MPPRTYTNPPPLTASAREAQKAFYCETCNKQYGRNNEFEDHLSSYEHTHAVNRKRLGAMNNHFSNQNRKKRSAPEDRAMVKIELPDDRSKPGNTDPPPAKRGRFLSTFGLKEGEAPKEAKVGMSTFFKAPIDSEHHKSDNPSDSGRKFEKLKDSSANDPISQEPAKKPKERYDPDDPCGEWCPCGLYPYRPRG